MSDIDRSKGWDKKAVNRIAKEQYGSLKEMFEAHGWSKGERTFGQIAPTKVVAAYGSVEAFVIAHADGRESNSLQIPMAAIEADEPNVWLTSFYGFDPEEWGSLGFANDARRQEFVNATKAGVLVVIYNSSQGNPDWRKVVGILQCSHEKGLSHEFMSPAAWEQKRADPKSKDKWNSAIKATRAWRVAPESMPDVRAFAPEATASGAWQHIGARGVRLSKKEVEHIKNLVLQEVDVYGEPTILGSEPVLANEALRTSKAGPVSKNPFVVKESEGPKHLYILKLRGNTDAFLGRDAGGRAIVKAGFSKSPASRCQSFNKALPKCAYEWELWHSGDLSGTPSYSCSDSAKVGEKVMHQLLCKPKSGESLGGEFFLTDPEQVEKAWKRGNKAARDADS